VRGYRGERASLEPVLVSVIIPTYNRWPLVREAVESALTQDIEDVEVVVVDDGSTGGTYKPEAHARFLAEVGMVKVARKLEPLHNELAANWISGVPRFLSHTEET